MNSGRHGPTVVACGGGEYVGYCSSYLRAGFRTVNNASFGTFDDSIGCPDVVRSESPRIQPAWRDQRFEDDVIKYWRYGRPFNDTGSWPIDGSDTGFVFQPIKCLDDRPSEGAFGGPAGRHHHNQPSIAWYIQCCRSHLSASRGRDDLASRKPNHKTIGGARGKSISGFWFGSIEYADL